jgi:hypothetical protein
MYHDQLNGLLALKVVAEQIAASLDSGLQLRRGHSQFSCHILALIYGTGVIVAEQNILASRVSLSMYLFV